MHDPAPDPYYIPQKYTHSSREWSGKPPHPTRRKLRALRLEGGVTLSELARRLKLSRTRTAMIEAAYTPLTPEMFARYCDALALGPRVRRALLRNGQPNNNGGSTGRAGRPNGGSRGGK